MHFDLSNQGLRNLSLLAVIIFLLTIAYEIVTQPRTYEDCILKNMQGGSNFHAQLLASTCESKFEK